ncbi:MAG: DNA topoisomerase IV subunit A, partial [Kiritimatiellae bacterium]|nr:DNA topoisomerase IV subunit A [Kiritimatiellia bacterium]
MDDKENKDIPQQEFMFLSPDNGEESESSEASKEEKPLEPVVASEKKITAPEDKLVEVEESLTEREDAKESDAAPAAEDVVAKKDFSVDDDLPEHESKKPQSRGEAEVEHLRRDNSLLKQLMDSNFIEYASYVICDRAIPKLEDGFKPVQRRIMHALHEKDDGRFIKVANIVGHTMQYHPHGDASIGAALVALANKRYLIDRQGNFGNILTGDPAAASRYIECRLTDLARNEIFNKQITIYSPSYDGRNKEPITLPSKLPLLLMLGAEGIAVGLSTKIMPHNFIELLRAQVAILRKRSFSILPDFMQGGIMDATEYNDGHGKIKLRALIEESGVNKLVIKEVPYSTTTESIIRSVEDGIKKKKIPVKSIYDYTAENVEIELQLVQGTNSEKAMKALYAFTNCEVSITSNIVIIRDNRPVEMGVKEILKENTRLLVDILEAELKLKEQKLEDSIHEKTLVQIFVEKRIYKRIEECKSRAEIDEAILTGFKPYKNLLLRAIVKDDLEMLLGVRIRRISLFDINKNKEEIAGIELELEEVRKFLSDIINYTVDYLKSLIKKYAKDYPRMTQTSEIQEIDRGKLTSNELKIHHDVEKFYLGSNVDGEEIFTCSSLDKIIMVWATGKYIVMPPPEKYFVDKNLVYKNVNSREREMLLVYTLDKLTYIKRFTFGGSILNKNYQVVPEDGEIILCTDDIPAEIFLKYRPKKNQRIN